MISERISRFTRVTGKIGIVLKQFTNQSDPGQVPRLLTSLQAIWLLDLRERPTETHSKREDRAKKLSQKPNVIRKLSQPPSAASVSITQVRPAWLGSPEIFVTIPVTGILCSFCSTMR